MYNGIGYILWMMLESQTQVQIHFVGCMQSAGPRVTPDELRLETVVKKSVGFIS